MTAKHLLEDGVADVAPVLGKSLLQRVLLPRSGEPLDVRTLYLEEATTNAKRAHSLSRTSLTIGGESEVSFCTYFNAFPASYWRRYSILKSVVLRVEVSGHCRIDVYRSKADASRIHVEGREAVDGDAAQEFLIDLGPFEDGGWIWFDITSDSEVVLE
ncbi:MAG: glycosyltransferase family 2 protein, partial [Rhodococcus sp.]|nr:glycosyltransferase family 2 protein [Rhodococcus sp. (in: high G+C Gram-positive bacteria)]